MADRISAPEMMEMVARWDSAAMSTSTTQLLYAWAPIPFLNNLPSVLTTPVELDGRDVAYNLLIFERRFEGGNWASVNCPTPHHIYVLLWAQTATQPGLDVLVFHIGAERGTMNRQLVPLDGTLGRCGLTRSPSGGSYVVLPGEQHNASGRPAIHGRIMVRRRGGTSECRFLQSPEELAGWGATCAMQHYEFEIDAVLAPVTSRLVSARGATRIRVSSDNNPGAIFVTDCASGFCHEALPGEDTTVAR